MNVYADDKKLKELKQLANKLPLKPGVYIMKNKSGEIIYVGKAKALKNRVTQYFGAGNTHTEKVRKMVSNVDTFEYIICDSEFEAFILENSLIKQNQPKYNILLKDDKGYHYIKISKEKWPRITAEKQIDKSGEFIGPYNSGYVVKETVDEVQKVFKLPTCNRNFNKFSKPCLNYHIGICDAPCAGKITNSQYLNSIKSAKTFIKKDGDSFNIIEDLKTEMQNASDNLDFELAAKIRDRIKSIEAVSQKQKVYNAAYKTEDVIATAFFGDVACVEIIKFRNSKLTDKVHYFIENCSNKSELYYEFLPRYYGEQTPPPRIIIDEFPTDSEVLIDWLKSRANKNVALFIPQKGEQKKLLDMCLTNAADNLTRKTARSGKETAALNELATLLGLDKPPQYIESYDISNTAGGENVAGMVVFKDGKPFKPAYKKFKIKSFTGQDDYKSMYEVLDRRFAEYEKGTDEGFKKLPDLILLDGGKGQLSAVMPALKKHNINVPVFGMVKDSKHRTRAITDDGGDITIKANRSVYTLVTAIQDEVHRFAIGYHKKRRKKAMLNSILLEIEGVGQSTAEKLIKGLKTVDNIRNADIKTLLSVKGISKKTAQNIYKFFND